AYPPSVMYCSYFSSINTGWAGGSYGYLYKTIDGGYNWTRQATGTDQRFWGSIWFYNDSIGWGVGGAGKIMHTTTGGQSLVNITSNENKVPESFHLYQNYPNPFNSQTTIEFDITEAENYRLEIFDVIGRKQEEILNEQLNKGKYKIQYFADKLSSGIYFYRLSSFNKSYTKTFLLIK
ncbi:MAG: T9SS type A sorting domain-containing protein, partial [Ignavibacteria bacterium]|nr:T9SS type A sorting domain-containing protein [Ignavibacteria bacterium]